MAETIPFDNGEKQPDAPDGGQVPTSAGPPGGDQLRQEYTSEEVTEIIRVALQSANDGEDSIVKQEEMLAIGEEFGLTAVDLARASEAIAASREETELSSKVKQKAMQDFKLNLVCYAAGIVGLFLLNWVTSTEYWWFAIPAVAYAPVVVVHGLGAKYRPDLAVKLLREETNDTSE